MHGRERERERETGGTRARQTRIQPATTGARTQPLTTGLGGNKADPPTWDVAKASWDKGRVNQLGSHMAGEWSSAQTACGKQSEIYKHIWNKPADTEGGPRTSGRTVTWGFSSFRRDDPSCEKALGVGRLLRGA